MTAGAKRSKAKWDSEAERKIIDIWADSLEEYNDKMLTLKEEAIATSRLNVYMTEEGAMATTVDFPMAYMAASSE